LRKGLQLELDKTYVQKQDAVEKADFNGVTRLNSKIEEIESLLDEYECIKEEEFKKLEGEMRQLEREIEEWKKLKLQSGFAREYEKAQEFKAQEDACLISIAKMKELQAEMEKDIIPRRTTPKKIISSEPAAPSPTRIYRPLLPPRFDEVFIVRIRN
jgi:hypothetical protein